MPLCCRIPRRPPAYLRLLSIPVVDRLQHHYVLLGQRWRQLRVQQAGRRRRRRRRGYHESAHTKWAWNLDCARRHATMCELARKADSSRVPKLKGSKYVPLLQGRHHQSLWSREGRHLEGSSMRAPLIKCAIECTRPQKKKWQARWRCTLRCSSSGRTEARAVGRSAVIRLRATVKGNKISTTYSQSSPIRLDIGTTQISQMLLNGMVLLALRVRIVTKQAYRKNAEQLGYEHAVFNFP